MSMSQSIQNGDVRDLERAYASALEEYLSMGGEHALRTAYEIGRTALADGRGVLDMAAMHHAAVARVLQGMTSRLSLSHNLERAQEFFAESLSPYEIAHRGFQDATSALRRLNETLEQEIQRIAHAVHDEAGQLLFAARLVMSSVAHDVDPSLHERFQEVGTILDQVEGQLRRLSHELRPTILDDLGLVPALEFLADSVSTRAGLSVRVRSSLRDRYTQKIETAVYRVVQEALTNVTKHAGAKNVEIRLNRVVKHLHCLVRDDGMGFDVPSVLASTAGGGLGLTGIRERLNAVGGTLQIDSAVNRGTELLVKIPVEK
jgi:two-component system, NarL family, sensor histidine kinase UhpB